MKSKFINLILIGLFVSLSLVSAHGNETVEFYNDHHAMMQWMFGTSFSFMWLFGWVFMILVIVTLILFIVWLIKQIQKPIENFEKIGKSKFSKKNFDTISSGNVNNSKFSERRRI